MWLTSLVPVNKCLYLQLFLFSAAGANRSDNGPILSVGEFLKKVTWSGKYFWNYVVRGETRDDGESSLSRDLGDAEDEMKKFQSSTNTRLTSVSMSWYSLFITCVLPFSATFEL